MSTMFLLPGTYRLRRADIQCKMHAIADNWLKNAGISRETHSAKQACNPPFIGIAEPPRFSHLHAGVKVVL